MQVYLALYTAESYPRTARKLGIWPFPRGHHHFVTKLPVKGAMLLLADQRFCPLLPEQHSMKPRKGLRALPAAQHESCYAACRYALLQLLCMWVLLCGCLWRQRRRPQMVSKTWCQNYETMQLNEDGLRDA